MRKKPTTKCASLLKTPKDRLRAKLRPKACRDEVDFGVAISVFIQVGLKEIVIQSSNPLSAAQRYWNAGQNLRKESAAGSPSPRALPMPRASRRTGLLLAVIAAVGIVVM